MFEYFTELTSPLLSYLAKQFYVRTTQLSKTWEYSDFLKW